MVVKKRQESNKNNDTCIWSHFILLVLIAPSSWSSASRQWIMHLLNGLVCEEPTTHFRRAWKILGSNFTRITTQQRALKSVFWLFSMAENLAVTDGYKPTCVFSWAQMLSLQGSWETLYSLLEPKDVKPTAHSETWRLSSPAVLNLHDAETL